jgi:hypothetical protein
LGFGFKVKLSASDLGLGFQCRAGRREPRGARKSREKPEGAKGDLRPRLLVKPRDKEFDAVIWRWWDG